MANGGSLQGDKLLFNLKLKINIHNCQLAPYVIVKQIRTHFHRSDPSESFWLGRAAWATC